MMDLMIFMGQSNMAGRAITCERFPEEAPKMIPGAGAEFRAISDPSRLYPVEEPFGVKEEREGGILEVIPKTGSMVTAFVNAYYEESGVPVLAVSASRGGSSVLEWQEGTPYLTDALERMDLVNAFIEKEGLDVRHRFMVWCQGETDADNGMSTEEYDLHFRKMFDLLKTKGIEKCFVVTIGNFNDPTDPDRYVYMVEKQVQMTKDYSDMELASTVFTTMRDRGMMKDAWHYYQAAYNECGTDAGRNAGRIVNEETL